MDKKIEAEKDWLRNVPEGIKKEVESLGLTITSLSLCGREEKPNAVGVFFRQKGNKNKIKELKELGWTQERGCIQCGVKYTKFIKSF